MIPKRIINAWFGRGKKSAMFERCLASQARVSGWEVIEINEDTIDPEILNTPYYRGVLGRGEYVKATEYARLWGLWKHTSLRQWWKSRDTSKSMSTAIGLSTCE